MFTGGKSILACATLLLALAAHTSAYTIKIPDGHALDAKNLKAQSTKGSKVQTAKGPTVQGAQGSTVQGPLFGSVSEIDILTGGGDLTNFSLTFTTRRIIPLTGSKNAKGGAAGKHTWPVSAKVLTLTSHPHPTAAAPAGTKTDNAANPQKNGKAGAVLREATPTGAKTDNAPDSKMNGKAGAAAAAPAGAKTAIAPKKTAKAPAVGSSVALAAPASPSGKAASANGAKKQQAQGAAAVVPPSGVSGTGAVAIAVPGVVLPAAVSVVPAVVKPAAPKNKAVGTRAPRALRRELFDAPEERRGSALD
ncbi:hypothetical protein B0H17DRAFT_1206182 [Mycena rosella]|uniref:Uncharacterized protein n=1 Tax=Mycena rosella TaxID=1033263 RepID=A0AAD7D5J8_MYCRO|nr:hypothetical protein B0H17DRAFT_1206182 [Mycena rosella]